MKRILFTLLILSSVSLVQAQTSTGSPVGNYSGNGSGLRFGISVNPGLSLGSRSGDFVLSGELGLYKNLTPRLEATFSAGLTQFFYGEHNENGKYIPIKAGARYALNTQFYVGANAGVTISTTDGGAYFVYSPMLGLMLNKHFDVALKYDHSSTESAVVGLNLTYKF